MSAPAHLDRRSGSDGTPPESGGAVMAKAASENFPVASRLLPRAQREHLFAIYGFARLVDDIGDESGGDRLAELGWAASELERSFDGHAEHPVFRRLSPMVEALGLDPKPFLDLIEANRQDQVVFRYPSFDELSGYCALSANPVGRLVLCVFGRSGALAEGWSDAICTGLQLVEHWQDVAEDYRAGRIYLPLEDLERFGVTKSMLGSAVATPELRRLLAFETGRARGLIESGRRLVTLFSGTPRVAIAGFIGGGLAQLDALERCGYDVLSHTVKASKGAVPRSTFRSLVPGRRAA